MAQHYKFNVTLGEVEIEVSTHHAWPTPRGEVYLQLTEEGTEIQAALDPIEARRLAYALLAAADVAKAKPVASLDVMGEPL